MIYVIGGMNNSLNGFLSTIEKLDIFKY